MNRDNKNLIGFFGEDRPLPHNLQAERSVLGAMIKEPELIADGVAMLKADDAFYSMIHREVYSSIEKLHRGGVNPDAISLAQELSERGKLEEIGGELFIYELTENLPTTANFVNWCEIVMDLAALRMMISEAYSLIAQGYSPDAAVDELLDKFEFSISNIRDRSLFRQGATVSECLASFLEEISREGMLQIPYGFEGLDAVFQHYPGEFHMIAAESGTGKTTFAISSMVRQAQMKIRTALYCTESRKEELSAKAACVIAKVSFSRIRAKKQTAEEWRRFLCAVQELNNLKDYIFFRGIGDFIQTPGGINADLRAIERTYGKVEAAHVDYLQDLDPPPGVKADDFNSRNDINSEGLDRVFKRLFIAGTVYGQLNREGQKGNNTMPKKYHLKYCGKVENLAHSISFLWAKKEGDDIDNLDMTDKELEVLMYADKTRNGPGYKVKFTRKPHGPYFEESDPTGQPRKYGSDFMPEGFNPPHPEKYTDSDLPYKEQELIS